MKRYSSIRDFLEGIQSEGRYTFTADDAESALAVSAEAAHVALYRQQKQRRVHRLYGGLYVIVPPEYRARGIVPPDWFVDALMRRMGLPYYTGLLSAAAVYGAAHQQPQAYFVVAPSPHRDLRLTNLHIRFLKRSVLHKRGIVERASHTGYYRLSSPALTAVDLALYEKQSGGLDRVADVIAELAPEIDPPELAAIAAREPQFSTVQRLGWLLERVGFPDKAEALAKLVAKRNPRYTVLRTGVERAPAHAVREVQGAYTNSIVRDARWRIIVNGDIEGDVV